MRETLHINRRERQRGITKEMVELTLKYGKKRGDRIRLGIREIEKLLQTKKEPKAKLLKIMDKGGLVVVVSNSTLITAYSLRR